MLFLVHICCAFILGLVIGWTWKPTWASFAISKFSACLPSYMPDWAFLSPPFEHISHFSIGFASLFGFQSSKLEQCWDSLLPNVEVHKDACKHPPQCAVSSCSLSECKREDHFVMPESDLEYLHKLVELKDGGPPWAPMMYRSTASMSYQAWRRDPATGPPEYRSRTVFENATPELVRDFFWDDEFRSQWDDMLIYSQTLADCLETGSMIVQWIRKFPFFCSDREYIIGRRIWQHGNCFYCVTKGVPHHCIPRQNKPRRVDLYYSSWCIRPVESTVCEVLLFHHEEMGIPWEIAKLGIRQGMWGAVKKIDSGLRAYQRARSSGAPVSRMAFMAQINTKVSLDAFRSTVEGAEKLMHGGGSSFQKMQGMNIPKLLIIGGAILVACSMDHGLLTNAVVCGIARRFTKVGKRL